MNKQRARNILAAVVLLLGPVFVVVAFLQKRPLLPKTDTIQQSAAEASSRVAASVTPKPNSKSWHDSHQILGQRLNARFEGGRLIELSGSLEDGEPSKNFDPKDKTRVTTRALEIARVIGPYVGVPIGEWSQARVVTGPRSAQVYFEQSESGLPLLPPGVVSMDFGPDGQLIHLSTRLYAGVEIQGEEKIPHTLAESIAREGVSADLPSISGRRVLWIPHPDPAASQTVAYRAYEFFVGPRQVLVNATTGHVISSRDRGVR